MKTSTSIELASIVPAMPVYRRPTLPKLPRSQADFSVRHPVTDRVNRGMPGADLQKSVEASFERPRTGKAVERPKIASKNIDLTDPETLVDVSRNQLEKLEERFKGLSNEDAKMSPGRRKKCVSLLTEAKNALKEAAEGNEKGSEAALKKLNEAKKAIQELRRQFRESVTSHSQLHSAKNGEKAKIYLCLRDLEYQMKAVGRIALERQIRDAQKEALTQVSGQDISPDKDLYLEGRHSFRFSIEAGVAAELSGAAKLKAGLKYTFETSYSVSRGGEVRLGKTSRVDGVAKVIGKFGKFFRGEAGVEGGVGFGKETVYKSLEDAVLNAPLDVSELSLGRFDGFVRNLWNKLWGKTPERAAMNVDNRRLVRSLKAGGIIDKAAKCRFLPLSSSEIHDEIKTLKGGGGASGKLSFGVSVVDGKVTGSIADAEVSGSAAKVSSTRIKFKKREDLIPETVNCGDEKSVRELCDQVSDKTAEKCGIARLAEQVNAASTPEERLAAAKEINGQLRKIQGAMRNFSALIRYVRLPSRESRKLTKPRGTCAGIGGQWGVDVPKVFSSRRGAWQAKVLREMLFAAVALERLLKAIPDGPDGPDVKAVKARADRKLANIRDMAYRPQFPLGEEHIKSALYSEQAGKTQSKRVTKLSGHIDLAQGHYLNPVKWVGKADETKKSGVEFELTHEKPSHEEEGLYKRPERLRLYIGFSNMLKEEQGGKLAVKILNTYYKGEEFDIDPPTVDELAAGLKPALNLFKKSEKSGKSEGEQEKTDSSEKPVDDAASNSFAFDDGPVGISDESKNSYGVEYSLVKYGKKWRLESTSVVNRSQNTKSLTLDSSSVKKVGAYVTGSVEQTKRIKLFERASSQSLRAQLDNYRNMAATGNQAGWKAYMYANRDAFLALAASISDPNEESVQEELKQLEESIPQGDRRTEYKAKKAAIKSAMASDNPDMVIDAMTEFFECLSQDDGEREL